MFPGEDFYISSGGFFLCFRQKAPKCYKWYSLLSIAQVTYHTATGSVAVCKWNITSLGQFV